MARGAPLRGSGGPPIGKLPAMAEPPDVAGAERAGSPPRRLPRPLVLGAWIMAAGLAWLELRGAGGGAVPRMALLGLGATAGLVALGYSFSLARGGRR